MTGEKSVETLDMKKQRKATRRKSTDKVELNMPCRDLGRADHEGWLSKKGIHFYLFYYLQTHTTHVTQFHSVLDYMQNIQAENDCSMYAYSDLNG